MKNAQIVLLTSDTDCDGTSYGAHRVNVPAHRLREFLADADLAFRHAQASEQMSSYYDYAEGVYTVQAFLAEFRLTGWDRDYFHEAGYTSAHMEARWNPWVYDDTIGIPALDTRYEESYY